MCGYDNASCQTVISVNEFLTKKGIPVLRQRPCLPDLSRCDFFLLPKLKLHLKGRDRPAEGTCT